MPQNAVYVGRGSRWGNPFRIGVDGDRIVVIKKYEYWLDEKLKANPKFLESLHGKDLACWCPLDLPCHADVLLQRLEGGRIELIALPDGQRVYAITHNVDSEIQSEFTKTIEESK